MARGLIVLLSLLCAQCCPPAQGEPREDFGRTRYHMRQGLADLRAMERLLVAGKLEEARSLTFFFTRVSGTATTPAASRDVVLAARSVATARTVDEALRAEVQIATACASCHVAVQKLPVFRPPSDAPDDRPTVAAQMARHQWAVDRLWEGIIGASDEHWRIALFTIASTVIPPPNRPSPAGLGAKLQRLARHALAHDGPMSLDERAATYSELLVTCAGCHGVRHK